VGAIKEKGQKLAIINYHNFSTLSYLYQDKNFKFCLVTFFGINMKSLYAKFQPFSFETEGGDRGWWTDAL